MLVIVACHLQMREIELPIYHLKQIYDFWLKQKIIVNIWNKLFEISEHTILLEIHFIFQDLFCVFY